MESIMNAPRYTLLTLVLLLAGGLINAQTTLELDNDTLHLKLDLTRGGAINYISKSGTSRNIVNIHDEGRYIQQSYYAGKVLNRIADGQNPNWSPWSWNPIQVGDSYNNRAEILESSEDGNTLYVKCIPMLWDMNNEPAEAIMEQWTTLQGNVLKVHNKLTCQRTDDLWGEGYSRNQELPAVYPISALKNLYAYFGELPFTGAPLSNPEVIHLEDGFWGRYQNDMVTEHWMAFVDDDGWGIGVYTPISSNFLAGMAGQPGYESTDGPTSYIAPVKFETLNKNAVFEYDYWLVTGTLNQIRTEIYKLKGIQENAWEFTDDLEGWHVDPVGGMVEHSNGGLLFTVSGADPQVSKLVNSWEPGNLRYLWLRIRNETAADTGAFSFFSAPGDSATASYAMIPNDSLYRDVMLDLDSLDFWPGDTVLSRFSLHPVSKSDAGMVHVDFIRFLAELIQVRTEGNAVEIRGLGNSLQLYAEVLPGLNGIEVDWSVDLPGVAGISSTGLLTGISSGVVEVTATAKDGSGKSGSIQISIIDTSKRTRWEFTNDLEGWDKNPNGGSVSWSDGKLRFAISGPDPYVSNHLGPWPVEDLKYLWMRLSNETAGANGAMYIFPVSGGPEFATFPLTPNDTEFRDIYVDMRKAASWKNGLVLNSLRLDPNNGGEKGDIYVDFIRFLDHPMAVSSEGNVTEIVGIGNTLQLYADLMFSNEDAEVDWQVDNPEIATVDPDGLLSSVSIGMVEVTATAKNGSGVSGSIKIKVTLQATSIDQKKQELIEIYPNPAGQFLNVRNIEKIQTMAIINVTGQVKKQLTNTGSHMRIEIGSLEPGIYLLKTIARDGHTGCHRFLKK